MKWSTCTLFQSHRQSPIANWSLSNLLTSIHKRFCLENINVQFDCDAKVKTPSWCPYPLACTKTKKSRCVLSFCSCPLFRVKFLHVSPQGRFGKLHSHFSCSKMAALHRSWPARRTLLWCIQNGDCGPASRWGHVHHNTGTVSKSL